MIFPDHATAFGAVLILIVLTAITIGISQQTKGFDMADPIDFTVKRAFQAGFFICFTCWYLLVVCLIYDGMRFVLGI